MTLPTSDDFLVRFPEFAAVDPDLIDLYIQETLSYVDETWIEGDYTLAVEYLVAHWLGSQGASGSGSGVIVSESFGPISRTYAQSKVAENSNFSTTVYGRRYLELRDKSNPAVLVI